jgi:hypothetical protein
VDTSRRMVKYCVMNKVGFESQPAMTNFVIFLSASRQMPELYLKLGSFHIPSTSSHFVIYSEPLKILSKLYVFISYIH